VSLDVTSYDWSRFDDPFITIEPIVAQTDPDFHDIFVPRVGLEVEPVAGFALRLGYYYQPTPIPEQDGPTTLVDLDKHVFSFGFGWTWYTKEERIRRADGDIRIEEVEVAPVSIDAFVQYHYLLEDDVEKEDPATSPVGGGYKASGSILNGGIQVILRF